MPQLRVVRVFSTEKRRVRVVCRFGPAARTARPEHPAAQLRLACSARCPADGDLCCPNPQLLQRSATTNSLGVPNPASLATRPIPPHSDPPAPPICTSEPSTLRHAPAIKPSHKHHVKLQNRSIIHPKSGADIAVTLNVTRQSFSFPSKPRYLAHPGVQQTALAPAKQVLSQQSYGGQPVPD